MPDRQGDAHDDRYDTFIAALTAKLDNAGVPAMSSWPDAIDWLIARAGLSGDGGFDPGELIRWAESYGHPEEWCKRAQAAHGRAEYLAAAVERVRDALAGVSNGHGCFDGCTGSLRDVPAGSRGHTPRCRAAREALDW